MGLTTITRTLEEQHVATKRGRKLWRTESVRRLLDNPAYTGVRYFNMTPRADDIAQKGSGTRPWRRERTAGEWVGVPVPAIVTQDLFDRVQQRLRDTRAKYRQPCAPYLLGGFVECGECGAGFSGYRRYVTKRLTIGKRRVYHKAAYKCNFRTTQNMHARANITRCENREVVTHLLEDAVFDIIRTTMLDPVKLRTCIDALKNDAETDHTKIAASLMEIAREIQAAEERKRQLIDLYASGNLSEEAYVNANVDVDREVHALKLKKADVVRGLPLLHKESIDVSIRQFSDAARVRLDACVSVEDKRQFLTDFVERIVYDRYRVVVVGCVTIKTQTSDAREIETRKLSFSISGEIDKNNLHKKPRKKFAEDGRLKAFGSGGRKQTVLVATS
jgi:site-specific DNA recombinase